MDSLEALKKAKIPGPETGIEKKNTVCAICSPAYNCGVCAYVKDGKMDDYLKMAASLKESLGKAKGFICSERFSSLGADRKLLSMSVWKNEESVTEWRNLVAHRIAQKHGRTNDFADYKITVVTPIRTYTMTDREKAPADSNRYFEV